MLKRLGEDDFGRFPAIHRSYIFPECRDLIEMASFLHDERSVLRPDLSAHFQSASYLFGLRGSGEVDIRSEILLQDAVDIVGADHVYTPPYFS